MKASDPISAAVVILSDEQTAVNMEAADRRKAIHSAYMVTCSPCEHVWSHEEQCRMAQYVLWAHQRLSAIEQISRGDIKHRSIT